MSFPKEKLIYNKFYSQTLTNAEMRDRGFVYENQHGHYAVQNRPQDQPLKCTSKRFIDNPNGKVCCLCHQEFDASFAISSTDCPVQNLFHSHKNHAHRTNIENPNLRKYRTPSSAEPWIVSSMKERDEHGINTAAKRVVALSLKPIYTINGMDVGELALVDMNCEKWYHYNTHQKRTCYNVKQSRSLLESFNQMYLGQETILVGRDLQTSLKILQLYHPNIFDTSEIEISESDKWHLNGSENCVTLAKYEMTKALRYLGLD